MPSINVERLEFSRYRATNEHGSTITFGKGGEGADFSPVELLLTAIAGCGAIDVDYLTARRAEPTVFEVTASGTKVRDDDGNHLTDIEVTFRVRFPEGEGGDKARERLPSAVQKSHDLLCTVSRTVELGTPVSVRIDES